MNIIKGRMWNDGEKTSLSSLLEKIPLNEWDWYLYEIDAVGVAPRGISMPDFEQQVLSIDTGVKLSWNEISEFANSLEDITTIFLAALLKPVRYESLYNGDLDFCLVLITISDSTLWEIKIA